MPLQATSGAASYDGFGGGVPVAANYIEDVFSTWLYTGTGATQTITNGIDLAGKGGLVWFKDRNVAASHRLFDTARGTGKTISSNLTSAQATDNTMLTAFNAAGFSLGTDSSGGVNENGNSYVSWTFRKQPKFFDVVTYTGDGVDGRTVAHSLGSIPGCIIIKRTNSTGDWAVYHRSLGASQALNLNLTSAASSSNYWGTVSPTATQFTLGSGTDVNGNGSTYVAYLFAHDAGGFGLTGTDNVISCGSYTGTGAAGNTITLGYEPQWLMIKRAVGGTSSWNMYDTMRGMPVPTAPTFALQANLAGAEYTGPNNFVAPNATGFDITSTSSDVNTNGDTYIYIAIRRGPMKTPTTGTSVYGAAYNYINDYVNISTGIVADAAFEAFAGVSDPGSNNLLSRLTGGSILRTSSTNAQSGPSTDTRWDSMNGMTPGIANNTAGLNALLYTFRRAPGFFDVVCYTGTGSNLTLNHNLGVAPELMIIKARSASSPWAVYAASEGINKTADLNRGDLGFYTETGRWLATPTATQFSVKPGATLNSAGQTQVAYLFASAAGVSKVGSYTGTGALQTINCGFTGGARWVMIKRADSAGDWFVYDSTRGITSGNDPYLLLNSTAAQVTGTNYMDTTSVGFQVTAAAPAGLNANGGTYIFLAIA